MMLGRIEGRRRRGQQRMRWLDGITKAMDINLGKLRETQRRPGMLQSRRVGRDLATEQQKQHIISLVLTCLITGSL